MSTINMMRCAIWYELHNLKNVKNTHGRVLLLVKLQVEACNFTKSNAPPWVFFMFFKLHKWYQITQRITSVKIHVSYLPMKLLETQPPAVIFIYSTGM